MNENLNLGGVVQTLLANTKKTNHVQDLYENGEDTMNFAEMSIKRPCGEHTATHTPTLGIGNRRVFWVKIAHE